MELQEIIDQARRGDDRAFGKLVHGYRDMALGYAMSVVGQEQAAEDAVQEALLLAYQGLDRLQESDAFAAWLRSIVRRRCQRAIQVRPALSLDLLSDAKEVAEPESNFLVADVRQAIAALPVTQQEALRLHYESGLSQREIGARLGLSEGAVNMRLHAARTRLRWRLRPMTTNDDSQTILPGRVLETNGPVVTLQFPTNSLPPIFGRLLANGRDSLCVIQHLSGGRIRAVAMPGTIWTPGQEVANTGEPSLQPLAMETVRQTVKALFPSHSGEDELPTRIKTIDLFAPLTQGGVTGIFAEWGVGTLVLLPELVRRLDDGQNRQTFFVFLPPMRDAGQLREVNAEITIGSNSIEMIYLPIEDPIAPNFAEGMPEPMTRLFLSRRLAEQGVWPCLDPLTCSSRRDDRHGPAENQQVREAIRRYYSLQFSLDGEGRRSLSQSEWLEVQRARKAIRFLSQPFFVAEPYTGNPGVDVASADARQCLREILAGQYDAMPPDAFSMVGAAPRVRADPAGPIS